MSKRLHEEEEEDGGLLPGKKSKPDLPNLVKEDSAPRLASSPGLGPAPSPRNSQQNAYISARYSAVPVTPGVTGMGASFVGEEEDLGMDWEAPGENSSARSKYQAVVECEKSLNMFKEAWEQTNWQDGESVFQTLTLAYETILPLVKGFKTPLERNEAFDEFITVFDIMAEINIIGAIATYCLPANETPIIQSISCALLSLLAPGPRVQSTPLDNKYHPSQCFFKEEIQNARAIPILTELIYSEDSDVRRNATVALANIAKHHGRFREVVAASGAPQHAVTVIQAALADEDALTNEISLIRRLTSLLSILVRDPRTLSNFEDIFESFLALMIPEYDSSVLSACCQGLQSMIPFMCNFAVYEKLAPLLCHDEPYVVVDALKAVQAGFQVAPPENELYVRALIETLSQLLSSDVQAIRVETCSLIGTMVHYHHFVKAITREKLTQQLVQRLEFDNRISLEISEILKEMTKGPAGELREFVNKELVQICFVMLLRWREFTEDGWISNVVLMRNILRILENIFRRETSFSGERSIMGSYSGPSSFVGDAPFEPSTWLSDACMDYLTRFFLSIRYSSESEGGYDLYMDEFTDRIKHLAFQMYLLLSKCSHHPDEANRVLTINKASHFLGDHFGHYAPCPEVEYKTRSSGLLTDGPGLINIKTFLPKEQHRQQYNQRNMGRSYQQYQKQVEYDIKKLAIPRNISMKSLLGVLDDRYHGPVKIQYQDEEGDYVDLDTDRGLSSLLEKFVKECSDPALKLFCEWDNERDPIRLSEAEINSILNAPVNADGQLDFDPFSELEEKPSKRAIMDTLASAFASHGVNVSLVNEVFARFEHFGTITESQFDDMMRSLGVVDGKTIREAFAAFDIDGDGSIDLREFTTGMSLLTSGSLEEKLKLAFRAYDKDRSGFIDREEVEELLKANFESDGITVDADMIKGQVDEFFKLVDFNGDGRVSFEEFKIAVHKGILTNVFGF